MLNDDGNDKFDEDSEYHFSDDDTSYDVDPEVDTTTTSKASAPVAAKENIFGRMTRSKRMLISFGVFIVLIFIVYKLVAPATTGTPSTDIVAGAAPAAMPQQMPTQVAAQQPVMTAPPQQQVVSPPPAQTMPMQTVAQQPQGLPPQSSVIVQAQPQQQMPAQQQPMMPQANNVPVQSLPSQPQAMPEPTNMVPQQQPTSNYQMQAAQSNAPTAPSDMSAASQKAIEDLQAEYQQKLSDYNVQNKAILDQLQSLATKVSAIEVQMNQLTQNAVRQNPVMGPSSNAAPITTIPEQAPQDDAASPGMAYNVQAIIPGRAWLKSENGDTVTVAEGDVVKDLGRIAKIDPYDGIVEINTGSKMVTLSYGNVG